MAQWCVRPWILCASISLLSSCSSPQSGGSGGPPAPITENSSVSAIVFARTSWQDIGFFVKQGERLKINPSGTWTGGQVFIGANANDTQSLFCDANGCNGDALRNYWVDGANYFATTINAGGDGNTGASSDPANYNRIIRHEYHLQNIARNGGITYATQKGGFGGPNAQGTAGLLDGKTICFGSNNMLLGAVGETAGSLKTGYWHTRAQEWTRYRDIFQHGANRGAAGDHANVVALVGLLNELIALYENAKCDLLPHLLTEPIGGGSTGTRNKMQRILGELDDHFTGIWEHAYDPVYTVTVPANNYGLLCRSTQDVIVTYLYGKPHHIIPRNDCAPTTKNVLIMKIVKSNEKFEDQVPIVVGTNYATEDFVVPKDGFIFLKNNDADTGIFDNGTLDSSFIRVDITRRPATNSN